MLSQSVKAKQFAAAIGLILGCFAVFFQLYLTIQNRTVGVTEILIRFISFFTILSNILCVISFASLLGDPQSTKFMSSAKTTSAVTVYIIIVGITYNFVLRGIWQPTGLQRVVDELLHVAMPLFYVVFWLTFVEKNTLEWKSIFPWAIFPLAYCIYVLIRGSFVHEYPYPFMDVDMLGYAQTLINCGYVLVLYVVIAILLIAVGKTLTKISMEKLTT